MDMKGCCMKIFTIGLTIGLLMSDHKLISNNDWYPSLLGKKALEITQIYGAGCMGAVTGSIVGACKGAAVGFEHGFEKGSTQGLICGTSIGAGISTALLGLPYGIIEGCNSFFAQKNTSIVPVAKFAQKKAKFMHHKIMESSIKSIETQSGIPGAYVGGIIGIVTGGILCGSLAMVKQIPKEMYTETIGGYRTGLRCLAQKPDDTKKSQR
jgi:hypothetical protein